LISSGDRTTTDPRESSGNAGQTEYRSSEALPTADPPPALQRTGEATFRSAVAELLGLRDSAGLRARAEAALALLPAVREAAEAISGCGGGSWPAGCLR
jgi:hypothetical protein